MQEKDLENSKVAQCLVLDPLPEMAQPIYDKDVDWEPVVVNKDRKVTRLKNDEELRSYMTMVPLHEFDNVNEIEDLVIDCLVKASKVESFFFNAKDPKSRVHAASAQLKGLDLSLETIVCNDLDLYSSYKNFKNVNVVFCNSPKLDGVTLFLAGPEYVGVIPYRMEKNSYGEECLVLGISVHNTNGVVVCRHS